MYKWEYVKGQRAPKAVLTTDKTDGALPLTVQFTGSDSSDEDPGDSIRYEWNFGDGSPISDEANPTHVYTQAGRYTAVAEGDRLVRPVDVDLDGHHRGQHQPDGHGDRPGRRRPVLLRRQDPVQGHGHRPRGPTFNCNDVTVTFVLGHDTHGHAEGSSHRLHRLPADRPGGRRRTAATCSASSPRATPTRAPGRTRPPLTTVNQMQIRQKHQEVEHVVTPVRHDDGDQHRRPASGVHRNALANTDWLQLNGPFNRTRSTRCRSATPTRPRAAPSARRWRASTSVRTRSRVRSSPRRTWPRRVASAAWATTTVPLTGVQAGKHELFVTFRAITGGTTGAQPVQPQLAELQRQRCDGRRRPARRVARAARCRPRCRSRSALRPRSGRSPRASPRRTRRARRPTSSRRPVTRR